MSVFGICFILYFRLKKQNNFFKYSMNIDYVLFKFQFLRCELRTSPLTMKSSYFHFLE